MQRALAPLLLAAGFMLAAGTLWASTPIKSTMREWKADVGEAELKIGPKFDGGELARIASRLADESESLSARLTSAKAQDLRARFAALASQARKLAAADSHDAAQRTLGALKSECRSCHDAYAN